MLLDISDLLQESFRWEHDTKNHRPNLITEIPKKKEKKNSGWVKFKRENFKGYRLLTFHTREFFRSIRRNVN